MGEVSRIYVRWSDDGQHIRKWSHEPFNLGNAVEAVTERPASPETGLREPSEPMVDAAARHLRETQQGGKNLTPWEMTAKATKRKWVELAWGTLRAALAASPGVEGGK